MKEKRFFYADSIRWRLISHLILLILVILLVTWFFQVAMLDTFYELTKRRELKNVANALSQNLDSEDLTSIASDLALDGSMRIIVYRTVDKGNTLFIDVDASSVSSEFSASGCSASFFLFFLGSMDLIFSIISGARSTREEIL